MKTSQKIAYSYIRFSSGEQAKGDSLRRQTDLAKGWCDRNNAILDTTISLKDLGKSAFTKDDRKSLAVFLKLCEEGKIQEGSYFIIESLDRLSRESIKPALSLLLSLTDYVTVVQLKPVEQQYGKDVDPMALMLAIIELSRANSESKMKSERGKANWEQARKEAHEKKSPHAGRLPDWICKTPSYLSLDERTKHPFQLRSDRAEAVKKIFELALKGFGIKKIVQTLLDMGYEPFGNKKRWCSTYISRILKSPTTYGMFQFQQDGKPIGAPIPNYFPAVVTEATFFAVQSLRDNEPVHKGKTSSDRVYLFNGLLFDERGEKLVVHAHTQKNRYFVPADWKRGTATNVTTFPIEVLENALLKHIGELDLQEILTEKDNTAETILSLSGRLTAVEAKIAELEGELEEGESATLMKVIRKLEGERNTLNEQLREAKQKQNTPQSQVWHDTKRLIEELKKAKLYNETRLQLRTALCRIVKKGVCYFIAHGVWRLACVHVYFTDEQYQREVVICYRRPQNTYHGVMPAFVWSDSNRNTDKNSDLSYPLYRKEMKEFLLDQVREIVAEEKKEKKG